MPQHQKYFSSLIHVSQLRVSSARTVAPRHTRDALCTAVGLASRIERIPLSRPQNKSHMPSSFGFAFSTTLAAEHLVEILFAHEGFEVSAVPSKLKKKVVEQKQEALLVHH